ncbi:uncharacterized protein [Dermacentor albipictus]|uniref:uncharacterized protein isoform X2 n=1 Tax=Dermacentor albipictus TaxID=60249 RepID=UPI0038FC6BAD
MPFLVDIPYVAHDLEVLNAVCRKKKKSPGADAAQEDQSAYSTGLSSHSETSLLQSGRKKDNVLLFSLGALGVLLIVVMTVLVFMLMDSGVDEESTDRNDEIGGGGDGAKGSVYRTTPRTRPTGMHGVPGATPRSMPTPSAAPIPRDPGAMSSSVATPSAASIPLKQSLLYSLLCTVREGFDKRTIVFPPDGLCDIITFDSLFTLKGSKLSPPYKDDFTHFMEIARQHHKTEYGIGINSKFCRNQTKMDKLVANPTTKANLDAMWEKRIYHYAQVNTPVAGQPRDIVSLGRDSARGLQMISALMSDKKDPVHRPSYTILHFPLIFPSMLPGITTAIRNYQIDVFVAIGYVTQSDSKSVQCRIVPPVLYSAELLEPAFLNTTYRIRLVRVIASLQAGKKDWPAATVLAVSVGMGGRHYFPLYPDSLDGTPGNFSLGHRCAPNNLPASKLIGSIVEVCKDRVYNSTFYLDTTFQALVAYDKANAKLFTYDSASSLRYKLCETKSNATSISYTIVADNIQFEDATNECGYGAFSRLRTLKALTHFFFDDYSDASFRDACLSVA